MCLGMRMFVALSRYFNSTHVTSVLGIVNEGDKNPAKWHLEENKINEENIYTTG